MIIRPLREGRAAPGLSFVLAIFCASYGGHTALAAEPDSIVWRDDYDAALEEARAANRLLWIQFTGPWCPNCTRMERDSFPDPVVVKHARDSFVPLKLRSDVHEQLALSFNLSALPATIIVAPTREVVAIQQGYLGPAEFGAFLRDSLSRRPGMPPGPDASANLERSQAPTQPTSETPSANDRIAMEGYCAVSLVRDRKLVAGRSEFAVRHNGLTYRFGSLAMKDMFREQPDRYAPLNNGACPVMQLDRGEAQPGHPRWGILYSGHLVLCANEEARRRFLNGPDRYAMIDVALQGFCIHCVRESGRLVPGDPRHEIAREGRRYWFPDISHRDAFVTSRR
jgi:YHS domain-containing protein